jgi:hypothetical protein
MPYATSLTCFWPRHRSRQSGCVLVMRSMRGKNRGTAVKQPRLKLTEETHHAVQNISLIIGVVIDDRHFWCTAVSLTIDKTSRTASVDLHVIAAPYHRQEHATGVRACRCAPPSAGATDVPHLQCRNVYIAPPCFLRSTPRSDVHW